MRIIEVEQGLYFNNKPNQIANISNAAISQTHTLSPSQLASQTDKLQKQKRQRLAAYQQQLALHQASNKITKADWDAAWQLNQVSVLDKFKPIANPDPILSRRGPKLDATDKG